MGWTTDDIPDLAGKSFIVTGANSGLGLETARALTAKGARVVLACRTEAKAQAALDAIGRGRAEFAPLDLASLKSVRAFAEEVARRLPEGVDGLANNAGVMAPPRTLTEDGFEMQFGTNHLGHFALTGLLLPLLARRPAARVVSVSSFGHWIGRISFDDLAGARRYERWTFYGQSKLANLLFTRELQRRLAARHPHVLAAAAHPGYADTNLQGTAARAEGAIVAKGFAVGNSVFAQSAASGALPTLRALTDPAVKGDDYFGPSIVGLWGSPTRATRSPAATNDATARRLWDESVRLTGVDFGGL